MPLPFFYSDNIKKDDTDFYLSEETSKHVAMVLRMQNGDALQLTDGKGNQYQAVITDNNRKKCLVTIDAVTTLPPSPTKKIIAISLIKNSNRFEWFLEKATEIGVSEIIPLLCARTDKQSFRHDRMKNILVSGMLQSQQTWLPALHEAVKFTELIHQHSFIKQKFIAHCEEGSKKHFSNAAVYSSDQIICIGPEGDFTPEEIEIAFHNGYAAVSLGVTRLRTETAGVVAATIMNMVQ